MFLRFSLLILVFLAACDFNPPKKKETLKPKKEAQNKSKQTNSNSEIETPSKNGLNSEEEIEADFSDVEEIRIVSDFDNMIEEWYKIDNYYLTNLNSKVKILHVYLNDYSVCLAEKVFTLKKGKVVDHLQIVRACDIDQSSDKDSYTEGELKGNKIKLTETTVFPASGKEDVVKEYQYKIDENGKIVLE